mmetsp:Transcript_64741/g.173643  ORF Transcript_64741/g.173643 Transcript_64741/m.173643 type:complete len:154 (+) Transcript_64741:1142-1603(+)
MAYKRLWDALVANPIDADLVSSKARWVPLTHVRITYSGSNAQLYTYMNDTCYDAHASQKVKSSLVLAPRFWGMILLPSLPPFLPLPTPSLPSPCAHVRCILYRVHMIVIAIALYLSGKRIVTKSRNPKWFFMSRVASCLSSHLGDSFSILLSS